LFISATHTRNLEPYLCLVSPHSPSSFDPPVSIIFAYQSQNPINKPVSRWSEIKQGYGTRVALSSGEDQPWSKVIFTQGAFQL